MDGNSSGGRDDMPGITALSGISMLVKARAATGRFTWEIAAQRFNKEKLRRRN
jgi:hypothetical protein